MQTKDIQVGADYAVTRWRKGVAHRATVLAVNVEHKRRDRYGSRRAATNGIEVWFADADAPTVVQPANVIQPWADQVAENDAMAEARRAREERAADTLRANAATLYALHTALLAKGAPLRSAYCYDDRATEALIEAGFKAADPGEFESTIPGALADALKGNFESLDVVAALLAEA